ncbi:hypothetical protein [Wolbachia endosymbiont of Mansonella perstans]|nr:hypothetical protein [Wolbachia endosymbiont of Mansonella perstans]
MEQSPRQNTEALECSVVEGGTRNRVSEDATQKLAARIKKVTNK